MGNKPIQELHINYFKFFADNEPIKIEGKHLLLYGENGSGKSSIYWALYTLLEAVYKSDEEQNKYFENTNDNSLLNLHAAKHTDSFVEMTLSGGKKYRIAHNNFSIKNNFRDLADSSARGSDFINYRFMLRLSDVRHSNEIDLFSLFVKEVFPYVKTSNLIPLIHTQNKSSNDFNEIWEDLEQGTVDLSKITSEDDKNRLKKEYADNLRAFVNEISRITQRVNVDGNQLLQNDLGYTQIHFELKCIQKFRVYQGSGQLSGRESDEPIGVPQIKLSIPKYFTWDNAVKKPHTFLNEAKTTSIGLAIRLALLGIRLDYVDGVDFQVLVLDDLLISLDMENRDVVLELLLNKYAQKFQLIILTHDAQFAQLVQHKIKTKGQSREWINYEMYEDTTSTIIKPYITQYKRYIERARVHYFKLDYEAAGNYLRKETERFCRDFLPRRRQLGKDFEEKDLNGLIISCIEYAKQNKLTEELFKALDQHRKFIFNVLSHDSYDVPRFRTELKKAFQTFEELDKINFRTILEAESILTFEMHDGTNLWKAQITIYEPLVLIKEKNKESFLGKVFVNYQLFKDGTKHQKICHDYINIKDFYEKWWNNSDQAKNNDFWQEIIISSTGEKLGTLRTF
ncbi:AAA family ATPase [Arcicella aquatica]|uniref:AAA family ATPase n=1 Tax=Arcicella aquatica TaxID=217141 RepID=A0ABU5QHE4_9BACT|nr:AAA family ATPase [Arcicella aquatica]MEA5256370.1 AAA family ATPase [Arcicella aquatica]